MLPTSASLSILEISKLMDLFSTLCFYQGGGGGAVSIGQEGQGAFDCRDCAFSGNKAKNGLVRFKRMCFIDPWGFLLSVGWCGMTGRRHLAVGGRSGVSLPGLHLPSQHGRGCRWCAGHGATQCQRAPIVRFLLV